MGKFVIIRMPSGTFAITEDKNQTNLIAICPMYENAVIIRDVYNSLRRQMMEDMEAEAKVPLSEDLATLNTVLTTGETDAEDTSTDSGSDDSTPVTYQ